ncbi:MAG: sulfurtransferase [Cellvibrionaceae bacterium]
MNSLTFSTLIIDAATLARSLNNVIVLDCRFSLTDAAAGHSDYRRGHIPGAHYCDLNKHLSGEVSRHGGRHPLPPFEQFIQQLHRWGICKDSQVVVYDDQKMAFASRAWWLLNIAGIRKVQLLDGGYQSWTEAGYAKDRRNSAEKTSKDPTQPAQDFDFSNTETFETISKSLEVNTMTLIDSREAVRYRGEAEPIDPIAGHIPKAKNLPWNQVTDDKGFVQTESFHTQRWSQITSSNNKTVVYCGSGVTACVNLLSAAIAGHRVSIYPGSWSDWISHDTAPIAKAL